ncbi:MAG: ABC transporter substrate-binding protein, partial [Ruminiclostridium sp.]|nr:ABC transporter substrate-binding protein [Ruminiclostridium sp.]
EKDGAPFLSQSEETWTNNIKWMLDTGIITKSVDAKDMIVKLVD